MTLLFLFIFANDASVVQCFVSDFVIFRCFCFRRSIYFVVAVNDNVVFIVVIVITVVVATSLAVVHINVN